MVGFHPHRLNERLDQNDIRGAMVELCKLPDVDEYFWTPCYVEEGYDTMQHAEAVGQISVAKTLPAEIPRRWQNLLAITHDIGKGVARDPGSRNEGDQHDVTSRIVDDLKEREVIDPAAHTYVTTLVTHEQINDWLFRGEEPMLGEAVSAVERVANHLCLSPQIAWGAMLNFHEADTRAYTLEARFRDSRGNITSGLHVTEAIYSQYLTATGEVQRTSAAEERFQRLVKHYM